ncbi:MAG: hypothetical protein Kow001_04150 [Acidobacteriota bacterium]
MPIPGQEYFWWLVGGLGALVAAALLLLVVWLVGRRRAAAAATPLSRLISSHRANYPCFAAVLATVQAQGLVADLYRHGDVRAALKLLEEAARRPPARPPRGTESLLLGPSVEAGMPRRDQAAVVTVLRAVYDDDRIRGRLSRDVLQQLDGFLDSLTA